MTNLPADLESRLRNPELSDTNKDRNWETMDEAADELVRLQRLLETQERGLAETHDAWTAEVTKRQQAEYELTAIRDGMTPVPSPSAICAIIGCKNREDHLHAVLESSADVPALTWTCEECGMRGRPADATACANCGRARSALPRPPESP